MIAPITNKQRAVYDYIVDCRRQIGVSPTLSEIADAFEVAIPTIRHHVNMLVKAGWIDRVAHQKAGITPSVEANALKELPAMIRFLAAVRDADNPALHVYQSEAKFILARITV